VAALKAVLAERPDVIVLDLAMPRMTGWEVIRLLRQDERMHGIPIITLSGQGATDSDVYGEIVPLVGEAPPSDTP
jgi:CheY-like chemotaxis protein